MNIKSKSILFFIFIGFLTLVSSETKTMPTEKRPLNEPGPSFRATKKPKVDDHPRETQEGRHKATLAIIKLLGA